MFYSKFMFVKKGPLAKVWLAAHFHRKLNKQMVQGTDINLSCKSILEPQAPLALRLTGQLLLGLVRIYQKKVKYLQEDCSDALTKMKSVFRAGAVDLPPESAIAAAGTITHPDNYDEIEYAIPDIPMENFDDMMADVMPEGRAASSLRAARLDEYSANQREITLDDDGRDDERVFGAELLDTRDDDLIPFEDPEDVELRRGENVAGEFDVQTPGERPDDLTSDAGASTRSRRKSVVAQEMSAFETTDAEQDLERASVASDKLKAVREPTTPAPDASPVIVEVEKKTKPKRKLRRDEKTELPSEDIRKAIEDTKDIRFNEGRPSIPFTKRAKFRDVVQKSDLVQLMKQPSSFGTASGGALQAEEQLHIAPELWGIVEQTEALARTRDEAAREEVAEQEEAPLKEEEEKLPEDERVPEEREWDNERGDLDAEYAVPDLGSLMEDSTVGDRSVAATPAPRMEEPEAEEKEESSSLSYRDDPEHFRQELTEFFGEDKPKKRGKKGAAETEEEEVAALGWGHRTDKTHQVLVNEMKGKTSLSFDDLMAGRSRTVAAGVFYQLLVLKSHSIIQVAQKAPFENIVISELKRTARAS